MDDELRKRLLDFLDFEELKSTSEMTSAFSRNHYDMIKFLEELESEDLIERVEIKKFTFWKKKVKDEEV